MDSKYVDTKKVKILIIDDTVDTVDLLRKRFRSEGYETVEAYDGQEGLDQVYECQPDIVLLDVMMPRIDGFEVCAKLKKDERTRHIPVLMLTAKSEIPDKVKGLDIGADCYITKPFDYKEVAARVRSLLAKKEESSKLAEKEKSDALDYMVNEVSHEVRNPLVAIGGFARRLQKEMPDESPRREYVDIIVKNAEALEKMVDHLIGLKSATLSYPDETNIHEILEDVLATFEKDIENLGISVEKQFFDRPPSVQGDRDNLEKAISNIIENSIEAMSKQENRVLTISTDVRDGYFEVQIADTGIGISKDKIKKIYDPFFTSKIYGPGLGLTFALKTIQNHRGLISVHSKEGQGTVFIIRLPL